MGVLALSHVRNDSSSLDSNSRTLGVFWKSSFPRLEKSWVGSVGSAVNLFPVCWSFPIGRFVSLFIVKLICASEYISIPLLALPSLTQTPGVDRRAAWLPTIEERIEENCLLFSEVVPESKNKEPHRNWRGELTCMRMLVKDMKC